MVKKSLCGLMLLLLASCSNSDNKATTFVSNGNSEQVESRYNPDTAVGKKQQLHDKASTDSSLKKSDDDDDINYAKLNSMNEAQRQKYLEEHTKHHSLFSKSGDANVLDVNVWIWRASLDVLQIMPLDKIVPESGIITTSWYNLNGYGNVKVNIFVLGPDLKAETLRVAVFKTKGKNQKPDKIASAQLTDVILLRARELRKAFESTK